MYGDKKNNKACPGFATASLITEQSYPLRGGGGGVAIECVLRPITRLSRTA
jgi:hypothetical protein